MAYVHFLDVFDPAGLPAGLSDKDAAEQARGLRLSAPSPRLLALLTCIRQQLPGTTVNVVSGQSRQPVEWVAGEPPRVTGEGVNCALWTLVLPVDGDFDTLKEAVPQLKAMARAQGLRVYDTAQSGFEQQHDSAFTLAEGEPGNGTADGLPGPGDILILELRAFLGRNVSSVGEAMRRQADMDIYQTVRTFLKDLKIEKSPDFCAANTRRLLTRLLQAFPFETCGSAIWCNRHPLTEPMHRSEGVTLIRVAVGQMETVLRHLLPLARELFLAVAAPGLKLYVDRSGDPKKFEAQPMAVLETLDPRWREHRLDDDKVNALLQKELFKALQPHGFAMLDEKEGYRIAFWRPLRTGGGRQVIRSNALGAEVHSERYQAVKRSLNWPGELRNAVVASLSLSEERQRDNIDWGTYPGQGGAVASPEQVKWAVEDMVRLILPQLDELHTARDLWNWQCRPVPNKEWFPGFADKAHAVGWLERQCSSLLLLQDELYAARVLSDEEFEPLLRAWETASQTVAQTRPRARDNLRFAAAFRALPKTPLDGPL